MKVTGRVIPPLPPSVLRKSVMKRRSHVLVYAAHRFEQWRKGPPSVNAARPATCPECGCAGRPVGRRLNVIGHGLRQRLQFGPSAPNGKPELLSFDLRRYRCKRCKAVIEVGPSNVAPRRLYSRPAIAWAMALFGIDRRSAAEVAMRLQPWRRIGATARRTWAQLRRWVRAIRSKALFLCVRRAPASWSHRRVAELTAMTVASHAPIELRTAPLGDQVWAGALHAR